MYLYGTKLIAALLWLLSIGDSWSGGGKFSEDDEPGIYLMVSLSLISDVCMQVCVIQLMMFT